MVVLALKPCLDLRFMSDSNQQKQSSYRQVCQCVFQTFFFFFFLDLRMTYQVSLWCVIIFSYIKWDLEVYSI